MYKKILLAIDGSEHSKRATEEAMKIASLSEESTIKLVYVVDFSKSKDEVLHAHNKEELELSRKKKLLPFEELLNANNIDFSFELLHGDPGPAIVEHANKKKFDMVVIGSRGLNTLQEMVLGSVSHKVVKRANCPVLIVK
ncbi:universal stress protein [Niallia circulans]|uniref:Universal stress protein n=2 Tax=Niallia TaxID=2837506 RepID=A0A0J1HNT2_NIACI|nr:MULTISPECIES: universal stress protein [Bacillaceae]EOR21656.1 universal stress protein [Niallia nealsonii AAU1]SLL35200.1 universal stress protein family protein [Mycobacteroides abscessus subsp. abscessus]HEO8421372.1 universal stress protein [Yersinia enterocolitica]KAB7670347.1 universal stress protein [Bacillus sp. B1-b2]KLV15378.1 universal stress protein [Niallia circulans]